VFGRRGGKVGRGNVITLNGKTLPHGGSQNLVPGDVIRLVVPGGGGYGDPLERDPSAVLADVVAGLVSLNSARDEYGVAIAGTPPAVDEQATAELRRGKAS
jgi:N-methylhydantoinase B